MFYSYDDVVMALGDLALTKVAGEIDDDMFDYYAASIVKQASIMSPEERLAELKRMEAAGELNNLSKKEQYHMNRAKKQWEYESKPQNYNAATTAKNNSVLNRIKKHPGRAALGGLAALGILGASAKNIYDLHQYNKQKYR